MENNLEKYPSFKLLENIFIPVMHSYLSGQYSSKRIKISTSFLAKTPLIIPEEDVEQQCMLLEEFLLLADKRRKEEIDYKEEIMQLKDFVCEEFNELCEGSNDEKYIDFIREKRQRIINAIAEGTKIDNKMIADKFFNDLMNGFESEALEINNFKHTAYVIIEKKLLKPYPIDVHDKIMQFVQSHTENSASMEDINKFTTELEKDIQEYLKVRKINDNELGTQDKLKETLNILVQKRQTCKITLKRASENQMIVKEFMGRCVEIVTIKITSKEFFESEITINYEELHLKEKIAAGDFEKLFDKLPRNLQKLTVELGKGNLENYQAISKKLPELKKVSALNMDLGWNKIGVEGAKVISAALKELTNISILNFNLPSNSIGGEGTKAVLDALKELKNITTLDLNLWSNKIGEDGIKAVSNVLKELKNISILDLDLGSNKLGEDGVITVLRALIELENISTLSLGLGSSNIGVQAIKTFSIVLKELKHISTLRLDLSKNKIGIQVAKELSATLKELKNILSLDLNFRCNEIGAEEIKAISASLNELKSLSTLALNFGYNNIGVEGAKTMSFALKGLKNISTLNLDLMENNIGEVGAKAISAALKELKNISTLNLYLMENKIRDAGVKSLLTSLKELKNLLNLTLKLEYNDIGEKGKAALKEFEIAHQKFKVHYQFELI